jgi:nickel superoxide dismutase
MKISFALLAALLLSAVYAPRTSAHCEIPCGIYGDQTRFELLSEHIATIEKSMKQIRSLSKEKTTNYNQIVRWVGAKEEHAEKIQQIVNQYFLTQRVKPVDKQDQAGYQKYTRKLALLHQMLVYAMQAKQTSDLSNVAKLRALLKDFKAAYSG